MRTGPTVRFTTVPGTLTLERATFSSCLHFLLDSLRRDRPLRVRTPARLVSSTALATLWQLVASDGMKNATRPSDRPP